LHETVAPPEPETLLGEIKPQVNPEGTVSVIVTLPVKPFTAVTVIVEVADCPALMDAGLVAVIVKSAGAPKVNVAVVV
jgi:hypothetical protein